MRHIIVVGAGAAGMLAAGTALRMGAKVTLFDKNARPARKVMITGKGRCNLTNNTELESLIKNTVGNGRFLFSAFNAFSAKDTMNLFEELGVPLKTERGNRVFPQSDKAVDIVDALQKYARGARYINSVIKEITETEDGFICTSGEDSHSCDAVIIATGGMSYPATGSSGDGYRLAAALGHTVIKPQPSLIPLETHEGYVSRLSGLSLKNVTLSLYKNNSKKPIFSDMGEMLFTHFGCSGPLALTASAYVKDIPHNEYSIKIDLKPALSREKLDERILRDFAKFSNKDIGNALSLLLPKSLIPEIIRLAGIDVHKKVNEITRAERSALIDNIKELSFKITSTRPIEEAIITSGGIKISEVNPKTMESKLMRGLYFAGEILDVDALTGGFNLQIAFSTGYLAGLNSASAEY